jgi:nucleoside-diphosphate-sugar epimerase
MKVAITGSTGYIGQRFATLAAAFGHQIVHLSRSHSGDLFGESLLFDITSLQVPTLPPDTEVLVHFAIQAPGVLFDSLDQEVFSAKALILEAKKVDAKFVYISSQTARSDAPTPYGRCKWIIEQEVLLAGGLVIRPGLVYGAERRGLFGELCEIVKNFYFLPDFFPPPLVQPIHVDDLVIGVMKISTSNIDRARIFCLGSPTPLPFSFFLRIIAEKYFHIYRIFIPFPSVIIKLSKNFLSRSAGLSRINSLFDLPIMNTADDLEFLGLKLKTIECGMESIFGDKESQLANEAMAFLSYVMKVPPSSTEISKYILAIQNLRGNSLLYLPSMFINFPILLILLEANIKNFSSSKFMGEFKWRLRAAIRMSEATIYGSERFSGFSIRHTLPRAIAGITLAVVKSAVALTIAKLLRPWIRMLLLRIEGERFETKF